MTDTLPAVGCASWCENRDGHTNVNDPADRSCVSPSRIVSLSRYPFPGVGAEAPVLDHLVGLLHREAGAPVPHIRVEHNDAIFIDLSVEDALRLAVDLLALADSAER